MCGKQRREPPAPHLPSAHTHTNRERAREREGERVTERVRGAAAGAPSSLLPAPQSRPAPRRPRGLAGTGILQPTVSLYHGLPAAAAAALPRLLASPSPSPLLPFPSQPFSESDADGYNYFPQSNGLEMQYGEERIKFAWTTTDVLIRPRAPAGAPRPYARTGRAVLAFRTSGTEGRVCATLWAVLRLGVCYGARREGEEGGEEGGL
eukprot:385735-Rhodomonas_salina.1